MFMHTVPLTFQRDVFWSYPNCCGYIRVKKNIYILPSYMSKSMSGQVLRLEMVISPACSFCSEFWLLWFHMSFRIVFFFFSISVKNEMRFFLYWDCIKSVNSFWRTVIFFSILSAFTRYSGLQFCCCCCCCFVSLPGLVIRVMLTLFLSPHILWVSLSC